MAYKKFANPLIFVLTILATFTAIIISLAENRQSREAIPGLAAWPLINSTHRFIEVERNSELSTCENMIDFETNAIDHKLAMGELITGQYIGYGVQITTSDPINHPLLIFDSRNPTGNWSQLDLPDKDTSGNLLFISENGNQENPSVLGAGGTITFTFSLPTTIIAIDIIDIDPNENGGTAKLYDENHSEIGVVPLHTASDSSVQTLDINVDNVRQMAVTFVGSGAIDNIIFCPLPGDCNNSIGPLRHDEPAIITEIFDGDSIDRRSPEYDGHVGCDTNANGLVEAGDISCLYILSENHSCDTTSNNNRALVLLSDDAIFEFAEERIQIPIRLNGNSNEIDKITLSLKFDTEILTVPEDRNFIDNDYSGEPDHQDSSDPCEWFGESDDALEELLAEGIINLYIKVPVDSLETSDEHICSLFFKIDKGITPTVEPLKTTITFADSIPPTCGDSLGGYVPCEGVNSNISIKFPSIYLPVILTSR